MKLYCQHCHALVALPDEDWDRDAAVARFGMVHIPHLQGDEDVFVVAGTMRTAVDVN